MKAPSPFDLFRPQEDDTAWLDAALAETQVPQSLKERNWLQLMLIDRHSRQFGTTKLESLRRVADTYAARFPH